MNKIINDEILLDFFKKEDLTPEISVHQLQIHIDYPCGCKVTQDNGGRWFLNCDKHVLLNNET